MTDDSVFLTESRSVKSVKRTDTANTQPFTGCIFDNSVIAPYTTLDLRKAEIIYGKAYYKN